MEIPDNIKQSWWNGLLQRVQQSSTGNKTYSIIKLTVLVDKDGNPILWLKPIVKKIEPKHRAMEFLQAIISDL